MQHSYLRYECADAFALVHSIPTGSGTGTVQTVACVPRGPSETDGLSNEEATVYAVAGSQVVGFRVRGGDASRPDYKISCVDDASRSFGTGRALHAEECVCVETVTTVTLTGKQSGGRHRLATGWRDGTVRVFSMGGKAHPPSRTLLWNEEDDPDVVSSSEESSAPPLVLRGHGRSPVTCLRTDRAGHRLASASSDGTVVVWDLVAETGLCRLQSHGSTTTGGTLGGPTSMSFFSGEGGATEDVLIVTSADGSMGVWDLVGRRRVQTVVGAGVGGAGGSRCPADVARFSGGRWRLIMGGGGGGDSMDRRLRSWAVRTPARVSSSLSMRPRTVGNDMITEEKKTDDKEDENPRSVTPDRFADVEMKEDDDYENDTKDDALFFMGILRRSEAVESFSLQKMAHQIKFSESRHLMAVCYAGSNEVELWRVRSEEESERKRLRRKKRRKEKLQRQQKAAESGASNTKKKGILDDDDDDEDGFDEQGDNGNEPSSLSTTYKMDPDDLCATDEFEFLGSLRCDSSDPSVKVKAIVFCPGSPYVALALSTNAVEIHAVSVKKNQETEGNQKAVTMTTRLVSTWGDQYGHPVGIRSVSFVPPSAPGAGNAPAQKAVTVDGKGVLKVWSVPRRSCVRSLVLDDTPSVAPTKNDGDDDDDMDTNEDSSSPHRQQQRTVRATRAVFLPGGQYVVVGTEDGRLLLVDVEAGEIVAEEDLTKANRSGGVTKNERAVNDLDLRNDGKAMVAACADGTVKFFEFDVLEETLRKLPTFVHIRSLQFRDGVVAVRYSTERDNKNNNIKKDDDEDTVDVGKRLVAASTLDGTIQVYRDRDLKHMSVLYGHSLPATCLDFSEEDDDNESPLLASGGTDRTLKIWGTDFGDLHVTLYGHTDALTCVRFIPKTHLVWSASRDRTLRLWDADRRTAVQILRGHVGPVTGLAPSFYGRGAVVLSVSTDRQVRVWERTKDLLFVEEERERERDRAMDEAADQRRQKEGEREDEEKVVTHNHNEDDHDAAALFDEDVGRKMLTGPSDAVDRLVEALDVASTAPVGSPLLLGKDPPTYILGVLRQVVRPSELEACVWALPRHHAGLLWSFLEQILDLEGGTTVELVARVTSALLKVSTHSNANTTITTATTSTGSSDDSEAESIRRLRLGLRYHLGSFRDALGYNLAAMQAVVEASQKQRQRMGGEFADGKIPTLSPFGNMGLGSEESAALQRKRSDRKRSRDPK